MRALCGSGTQLQTQALLHEKIQCLKQLGLKGENMRRAENSPFMSCRLALALCFRHLTHFLSFALPLFLFSLICLPYRASRESVLSSRSVPDSAGRKTDWGKSVQVGALRTALLSLRSRFTWLSRRWTRTTVTPIAVRGGWHGDLKPKSLKVTVLSVSLVELGELHDGKKQGEIERKKPFLRFEDKQGVYQ